VAWANGEVYGYIIEKKVRWEKSYADEEFDDEEGVDWVQVESCWGYHGRDWAEEAAKEALKDEIIRRNRDWHNMTWFIDGETATARVDWNDMEQWLVANRDCKDRLDMSDEDFKAYMDQVDNTPYRLAGEWKTKADPDSVWSDVEEAR
jgi:hypothetical protein